MNDNLFGAEPPTVGPEPATPTPGPLQLILGIFTSPVEAFRGVVARAGSWWMPTALIVLASIAATVMLSDMLMEKAVAELHQQELPEDQIDVVLPVVRSTIWATGIVAAPVGIILIAAVLYVLGAKLMGGTGSFVETLAVTAYASVVGVLEMLIRAPLALAKGSPDVYLGPAALLPADMASSAAFHVLAQFDVFALWKALLVGVGLAVAHTLPMRRTVWTVVLLWIVLAAGLGLAGAASA